MSPQTLAGISAFRASSFYLLVQTAVGVLLEVQLQPIMQLYITANSDYQAKTCGMCTKTMCPSLKAFMTTKVTCWKQHVIGYDAHMIDVFASLLQVVFTGTKKRKQSPLGLWVEAPGYRKSNTVQKKLDVLKSSVAMPYYYWLSEFLWPNMQLLVLKKAANTQILTVVRASPNIYIFTFICCEMFASFFLQFVGIFNTEESRANF